MSLRIVGTLVDVEDVPEFTDRQTNRTRAAHKRLHIFAGREVLRAKLAEDFDQHTLPKVGEPVAVEVRVNPYVERGNGRAAVAYTALSVVADSTGRRVAPVQAVS